jgi:hypothetical protein
MTALRLLCDSKDRVKVLRWRKSERSRTKKRRRRKYGSEGGYRRTCEAVIMGRGIVGTRERLVVVLDRGRKVRLRRRSFVMETVLGEGDGFGGLLVMLLLLLTVPRTVALLVEGGDACYSR